MKKVTRDQAALKQLVTNHADVLEENERLLREHNGQLKEQGRKLSKQKGLLEGLLEYLKSKPPMKSTGGRSDEVSLRQSTLIRRMEKEESNVLIVGSQLKRKKRSLQQ